MDSPSKTPNKNSFAFHHGPRISAHFLVFLNFSFWFFSKFLEKREQIDLSRQLSVTLSSSTWNKLREPLKTLERMRGSSAEQGGHRVPGGTVTQERARELPESLSVAHGHTVAPQIAAFLIRNFYLNMVHIKFSVLKQN